MQHQRGGQAGTGTARQAGRQRHGSVSRCGGGRGWHERRSPLPCYRDRVSNLSANATAALVIMFNKFAPKL